VKYFPLFAGPDVALGIPITSVGDGISGPDLRTVIGATMYALKPDEVTILTWVPSIVPADGQSGIIATLAKLRYPFTGTELDTKGLWRVSWLLALPDTPHTWPEAPEDTSVFVVLDKWGRQ
jgi:hypothetical protein